jgi:hypothetical protein
MTLLINCLLKFRPIHNKFVVETLMSDPSKILSTEEPSKNARARGSLF